MERPSINIRSWDRDFDPQTHAVSEDEIEGNEDNHDNNNDEDDDEDEEGGGGVNDSYPSDEAKLAADAEVQEILSENDEEFPETLIDQNEMMETSDDQDIMGSPHSSFSYDDTITDQEIDGLTNYNIILEYPQLNFKNDQLLSFIEELNDWFTFKDLQQLKDILHISKNTRLSKLPVLRDNLIKYKNTQNGGKLLQELLSLAYLSMGSFNDARSHADIVDKIRINISEMIKCEGLFEVLTDIIIESSAKLTEPTNLEVNVDMKQLKLISSHYFYSLTIVFIMLLLFNTGELDDHKSKKSVNTLINEKEIMIEILKALDRWKWISINSDNEDPSIILESMSSKVIDSEKIKVMVVSQFRLRNTLNFLNNLILFQFGDLKKLKATEDFLKFKFEDCEKSNKDEGKSITTLDYNYYVHELLCRYPTYTPPKLENSEILELIVKNEKPSSMSKLINVESLPINQHQNLKNSKENLFNMSNGPPEIHIATPMPSPTLTPQHTGNTKNCSSISEFDHSSNEIKKKLYITQSSFPNIYPSTDNSNVPRSIQEAVNIFYNNINDDFNTKQFTTVFEEFIVKENGIHTNSISDTSNKKDSFIFTEKDIEENPMFEDEIQSLQNVEEFYTKGLPYLNSLVSIVLKLLNSNIIPSQQTDGKTRQRTPYTSKYQDAEKPYLSSKLNPFEKQKLEVERIKETMLKNASTIIMLLQEWFKLSHVLKFEYFSTLLYDQDFLIYLFRYLDSNKIQAFSGKEVDFKEKDTLINNRIVYCDYKVLYYLEDYNFFKKCLALSTNKEKEIKHDDEIGDFQSIFEKKTNKEDINPLSFILPFVPHSQVFTVINPNLRCCILLSNLLGSMYLTIEKFKIQRIYKLIGLRPTEILRFYLTLHNEHFYSPILKTIKLISPFIGKKWRANNMDLISFVYLFEKIGLKDPWLNNFLSVGIEENTKRGYDNESALRSLVKYYNYSNYGETLKKVGYSNDINEFMMDLEGTGDYFANNL